MGRVCSKSVQGGISFGGQGYGMEIVGGCLEDVMIYLLIYGFHD